MCHIFEEYDMHRLTITTFQVLLSLYAGIRFCFVALRPKSTATCVVMTGRSVHLITLFPGQA